MQAYDVPIPLNTQHPRTLHAIYLRPTKNAQAAQSSHQQSYNLAYYHIGANN